MKKPMRPAPAATNVVVHARLKKVRIVCSFRLFDWFVVLVFVRLTSRKFEQDR